MWSAVLTSVSNRTSISAWPAVLGVSARLPIVGRRGPGVVDGARQRAGRQGAKRVDEGAGRVGHGQHVGGLDRFPAADRGAVEAQAVGEDFLGQFANRTTEM